MAVKNNRKIIAAVLGALSAFGSRSSAMNNNSGAKPVSSPANNPDSKIVGKSSNLAKPVRPVVYQRNNTSNVQEEDNAGLVSLAVLASLGFGWEVIGNVFGLPTASKGIRYLAGIEEKNKSKLRPVVLINNREDHSEYNIIVPEGQDGDDLSSSSDFYGPAFPYYPPNYGPGFGPRFRPRFVPGCPKCRPYGLNSKFASPDEPLPNERELYMNLGRLSNVELAFSRLFHGFVKIDTDKSAETPKVGSLFPTHAGKFCYDAHRKFWAMMAAMAKAKCARELSNKDPDGIFELFAKMCSLNGPTDGHAYLDTKYGSQGFNDNSFKIVYKIDGREYDVIISFEQKALAGATPSDDEVLFCVDFRLGEEGNERYHVEFRNNDFTVRKQYYNSLNGWGRPAKTGNEETPDPNNMPVIKLNYVFA